MGRSGIGLGLAGVAMIASGAARAQGTATAQDAARYQGQIGVFASSREATLTLSALSNLGSARLQQMRVDAVLKR